MNEKNSRFSADKMSLEIVLGPMWAGKSSYILSKIRQYRAIGCEVLVLTSSLDNRYGTHHITSHNGESIPATAEKDLMPIKTSTLYKNAKLIIIEESQFFTDLFQFVTEAVDSDGKNVICVGLDGDSERKPFGDILKLIPYCDTVMKITALCPECSDGTPALFSYRTLDLESQVAVGNQNLYKPLCRKHYLAKKISLHKDSS